MTVRLWIHFCTRPQLSAAPTFTPLCIMSHLFQPDTAQKWTLKPRNRKPARTFLSFLGSFFKKKKKKVLHALTFLFFSVYLPLSSFFPLLLSPPLTHSSLCFSYSHVLVCSPSPHPFPATHSSPHPLGEQCRLEPTTVITIAISYNGWKLGVDQKANRRCRGR